MPRSVKVSQLMMDKRDWPQFRADTLVKDAIKILRILTEDYKLVHGHSNCLIMGRGYELVGKVRLINLLKCVRPMCDEMSQACELEGVLQSVEEIMEKFPCVLEPDDNILHALDLMMLHDVEMLPVMESGKLVGLIKLPDIFGELAALLFDVSNPGERERLMENHRAG